jgi:hypothetical protein
VNELIMFATVEEIPLIITWKILALDEALAELMIDEVEITPFTFEVKVLVAEVKTLVVVGSNPTIEVVDITPLTFEVTIPPA